MVQNVTQNNYGIRWCLIIRTLLTKLVSALSFCHVNWNRFKGSRPVVTLFDWIPGFSLIHCKNAPVTIRDLYGHRKCSLSPSTMSSFQTVNHLLRALHLRPYADTMSCELSGGNRRKLSVAVALISQPPLVFLVCSFPFKAGTDRLKLAGARSSSCEGPRFRNIFLDI